MQAASSKQQAASSKQQEACGEIEIVPANNALMFQGMDRGKGKIDMHAGVWIPNPRSFHEECAVKKGAVDYSKNSHGARTGFAYPDTSWKSSISRPSSILARPDVAAEIDSDGNGEGPWRRRLFRIRPADASVASRIAWTSAHSIPRPHRSAHHPCRLPCGRGRPARHPSGSASVARSSYQRKTPGDVRAGSSCRSFPAGTVAMHRTAPSVDTPATPHLSSACERGRQAISQVFEIKSGIPRSIWPAPSRT